MPEGTPAPGVDYVEASRSASAFVEDDVADRTAVAIVDPELLVTDD